MAKKCEIDEWIKTGKKVWLITIDGPVEVELIYRDFCQVMVQYGCGRTTCLHDAICETRNEALYKSIDRLRMVCNDKLYELDKQFIRLSEMVQESDKHSHIQGFMDPKLQFFDHGYKIRRNKIHE
jgi:hypothetical protein